MNKKSIIIWILTFVLLASFASADLVTNNIVYYSYDDINQTSGNPEDISGNGNTGTRVGATAGIVGLLEQAYNYDGSDSVTLADTGTKIGFNDFSVSMWVDFDALVTNDRIFLIGSTNDNRALINYHTDSLAVHIEMGSSSTRVDGVTALSTGQYYHIVLIWDNTAKTFDLYLDDSIEINDGAGAGSPTAMSSDDMFLMSGDGTEFTEGDMDEFSLWNRKLTAGEVSILYNSGDGYNYYNTTVVPTFNNFTIAVTDDWDDSEVNNVTANITLSNGSSYLFSNSTGNVIITTIDVNSPVLANVSITNPNYFNAIYNDVNITTQLAATMNQSQIMFNASNIFGELIPISDFTIDGITEDQDFIWALKAGPYNVTFSSGNFINSTQEITVSILQNSTIAFTDLFDTNFNIQAKDFISNGSLLVFNVTINQTSKLYNNFSFTTNGNITIGLMSTVLYNITVQSPGYLTGLNQDYNISTDLVEFLHSSTSMATFIDANTTSPIVGKGITVTYPGGFQLPLITDNNGTVDWVTILNGVELFGVYNITLDSTDGFDSPQSFLENITVDNAPLNATYFIQPSTLNITIRDASDGSLIVQSVIVTIVGIGQFNVTGGNLIIRNGSISAGSYTLYALSDGFAIGQITFEYNAREVENINVFLLNSSDPNTGTLSVIIFDEGFNLQLGADVRILQYFPDVDSFVQVGQCFSNSNGECIFTVQIGTTLYQLTASKIDDDKLLQGVSSTTGEIFYVDEYSLDIHMFPSDLYEAPDLLGFFLDTDNETLVGNTSFLTGEFLDIYNFEHEVCISYYRQDLSQRTVVANTCVNGSSGVVNVFGGFLLNRSNTYIAEFYVLNSGVEQVQFSITYPSLTSFESQFDAYLRYIIIAAILSLLSLSLLMKNLYIFAYGSIPVLIIFVSLIPSWVNWAVVSGWIILDLALMYLARKQEANLSV